MQGAKAPVRDVTALNTDSCIRALAQTHFHLALSTTILSWCSAEKLDLCNKNFGAAQKIFGAAQNFLIELFMLHRNLIRQCF